MKHYTNVHSTYVFYLLIEMFRPFVGLITRASPGRLVISMIVSIIATIILGLGASLFGGIWYDIDQGLDSLVRGDWELEHNRPFTNEQYQRLNSQSSIDAYYPYISLITTGLPDIGSGGSILQQPRLMNLEGWTASGIRRRFPTLGGLSYNSVGIPAETRTQRSGGSIRLGGESKLLVPYSGSVGLSSFNPGTNGRFGVVDYDRLIQTSLVSTGTRANYGIIIESSDPSLGDRLETTDIFAGIDIDNTRDDQQQAQERIELITIFLAIVGLFIIVVFTLSQYFLWDQWYTLLRPLGDILHQLGKPRRRRYSLVALIIAVVTIVAHSVGGFITGTIIHTLNEPSIILIRDTHRISILVFSWGLSITPGFLSCASGRYKRCCIIATVFAQWGATTLFVSGRGDAGITLIIGVALIIIIGLTISGCIRLLAKRSSHIKTRSFIWFDALRLTRKPGFFGVPIIGTLVVLSSVFLLSIILIRSIKTSIQPGSLPDIIVLNLTQDDIPTLNTIVSDGLTMYDRIGARIVAINNTSLTSFLNTQGIIGRGRFEREFNTTTLALDDPLIKGRLARNPGEVSLDNDFARDLGLEIGDIIRISVFGSEIDVRVVGIRDRNPQRGLFFFLQLNAQEFEPVPKTYFGSIVQADETKRKAIQGRIAQELPSTTLIDTIAIRESILVVINEFDRALGGLAGIIASIVCMGLCVVGATIWARLKPLTELYRILGTYQGYSYRLAVRYAMILVFLGGWGGILVSAGVLGWLAYSYPLLTLTRSGLGWGIGVMMTFSIMSLVILKEHHQT